MTRRAARRPPAARNDTPRCGRTRRLAFAAVMVLAAASCRTVPQDQVGRSAGAEQVAALDTFDMRLLELRLAPDASALAALRADLDRAAAEPGLNRRLRARVEALKAEAALRGRDLSAARKSADSAAALTDAEQGVWIVRAALEAAPAARLSLMDKGIARVDDKSRLLCERGEELLKAGRYAQAAQDLDEGLRGLDPRFNALYGTDRDRAFSLVQAARDAGTSAAADQPAWLDLPLTLRGMIDRAVFETRFLAALSPDPKPSVDSLLPAVKDAGLLLDPAASPGAPALRKNVAFFLWGVISRTEHDPKLLTRYRLKYTVSPVPDLDVNEQWFDAALGVVEREVMDLPDGVHFNPDAPVTGLEYLGILGKLKKLYR
jgi:tetratricopeptide (TPR) repeat protein